VTQPANSPPKLSTIVFGVARPMPIWPQLSTMARRRPALAVDCLSGPN
jgi:hypothetical protein